VPPRNSRQPVDSRLREGCGGYGRNGRVFPPAGSMSFNDAVREVNLRFGDSGVSVLQKVAAVYPHSSSPTPGTHHYGDQQVYSLVRNVTRAGRVETYVAAEKHSLPPRRRPAPRPRQLRLRSLALCCPAGPGELAVGIKNLLPKKARPNRLLKLGLVGLAKLRKRRWPKRSLLGRKRRDRP
jgi:hypothetical protein